jgi:hypothetical protein
MALSLRSSPRLPSAPTRFRSEPVRAIADCQDMDLARRRQNGLVEIDAIV